MSLRLARKVALVTGAGSGIGAATAQEFARQGAKVGVLDVRSERAGEVAGAIRQAGGEAFAITADVSSASDIQSAIDAVVGQWSRLDVLVNNAAIQIMGPLHEYREEDFDRTIAVNLKGAFLGIRSALKVMLAQGAGVILSTSSVLGLVGDPDLAVYGSTKGGILAMTKAVAVAYGRRGIRAVAVCPGDVNTPLVKEFFDFQPDPDEARSRVYAEYPLGRIAEPQEIARVHAFLASEDAAFISGTEVVVDGGLLASVY